MKTALNELNNFFASALGTEDPEEKICPNCGEKHTDNEEYCDYCRLYLMETCPFCGEDVIEHTLCTNCKEFI